MYYIVLSRMCLKTRQIIAAVGNYETLEECEKAAHVIATITENIRVQVTDGIQIKSELWSEHAA